MTYYLVTTPTGQTLWTGKVEFVSGGVWLLSPGGQRLWSVASECVRELTIDEARAHLATVGKAKR